MTNYSEFHGHLKAQQKQIQDLLAILGEQTRVLETIQEQNQKLSAQIIELSAAFQVFSEFAINASPELKRLVADATTQILEKRDLSEQPFFRDLVSNLRSVATTPTRLSPEGRRQHIKPVDTNDESDNDT